MRKQIKLLASEYNVGDQTELLECPFCGGGMSKERSFTMNIVPEGILYVCYRASCNEHGFIPSLRMSSTPIKEPSKQSNPFTGDVSPLPEMVSSFLIDRFPCLTQEILNTENVQYSNERQRILLPLYDVRGLQFGFQARSYTSERKAISYFDNLSVPKMHFPAGYRRTTHATLVEDHFSAMILCAAGVPSIALIGTNFNEDNAKHLAACGITELTFFLDLDAVKKSISYKMKYSLDFKTDVYFHKNDPKDLTIEQLEEFKQWIKER